VTNIVLQVGLCVFKEPFNEYCNTVLENEYQLSLIDPRECIVL